MIRWMLVSWAANAVVLAIAGAILGGVTFHDSASALVVSAAIFGVLNTIFKPLIKLITLPLAVLTLGIAWFFVAMLMLWLTQLIVPKFDINGFSNYVWATIIVWAVNVVLDVVLRPRARAESPARA